MNETGGISRRSLLGGAATAGLAAAGVSVLGGQAAASPDRSRDTEPFYGRYQSGITTAQQNNAVFAAFDVVTTDKAVLIDMLQKWTATAEAMTKGRPAPPPPQFPGTRADSGLALGLPPARLTVTFGVGPTLFDKFGLAPAKPAALAPLPAFDKDQLVEAHTGGDLLLQICADDPQVLAHAFLQLRALAFMVCALRWSQQGFVSPPRDGNPPRNLIGHYDGTANPSGARLEDSIRVRGGVPAWFAGGSYLVFRKIKLALPNWSLTAATEQDRTVGRRLEDGSPLSAPAGSSLRTPLDLAKLGPDGRPLIDTDAHVRHMHPFTMYRRAYNFDYGFDTTRLHSDDGHDETDPGHGGHEAYEAGLLFVAFVKDPAAQFIPAQQALSGSDLLGQFMTPTGSGLFAVPPGLRPGQYFGQSLLA